MKRPNRINLRWARKLLKTKNFVLLTDTEGVIYLGGIDPKNFDDVLMVMAQAQELTDFRKQLDHVIEQHKVIQEEVGNANIKMKRKVPAKKKPAEKIKVKYI